MRLERSSVRRFDAGIKTALSALLVLLAICFQNQLIVEAVKSSSGMAAMEVSLKLHLGLAAGQFVAAFLVLSTAILLPRRPTVFMDDGKPVDSQFTVSAFNRYTFGWCKPVLALAMKKTLNLDDLPGLSYTARAKTIHHHFVSQKYEGTLLKKLLYVHWKMLVFNLVLIVWNSVFKFIPQLTMLGLLRLLEKRSRGEPVGLEAWLWVISMGLGLAIQAWVDSWMVWISLTQLMMPSRIELSALVFAKAMRKKDVKEAEKKAAPETANGTAADSTSEPAKDQAAKPVTKEDVGKTKQSTINLISVDTKRISNFGAFARYLPESFINFFITGCFLVFLIGWIPLLAGLLSFAIVIPLNVITTKRYGAAQKVLMKTRDEKTAAMTEALQGMRQIKFSALESQWQDKIGEVRGRELALTWRLNLMETVLMIGWNAGPLLLSTVALSVYAYIHGELTPSVAFTALGAFKSGQAMFGIVPHLLVMWKEARISIDRIEKYLASPEKVENLTPGDHIAFENASLAWPSDADEDDPTSRFVLRKVNLSFPTGELSVISGETGSGKSLILSSILGECDLLEGVARVPKALPLEERFDHKANADNWILPSSIAFVAQIPWIENATLKDNILFGLPFDETRYKKTLSACALEKDLDILTDGDMTEIGANGINISGGQRWRVTLARALYSRAGILVFDDIFSAVDAHVGRWIFENALIGELGQGRTRILATHHAALCISKTSYAVQLGDGTIKHAGTVESLKKEGKLTDIIQIETAVDDDEAKAADEAEQLELVKVQSAASKKDLGAKPKKFVEDEHREEGRVKKKVYMHYIRASGGVWLWVLCFLLFAATQSVELGRAWWVKVWTSSYEQQSSAHFLHVSTYGEQRPIASWHAPVQNTAEGHDLRYYLIVYV
jgi:ABC-type multidrug transport system fused ATPase/permease subunit